MTRTFREIPKILCLFICLLLIGVTANAQLVIKEKRRVTTIGVAYYADISELKAEGMQPGFRIESEIPMFYSTFSKSNNRTNISKTVESSLNLIPFLSYYKRDHFHKALNVGLGIGYKFTMRSGFFLGANIESAWYKSFLDGHNIGTK